MKALVIAADWYLIYRWLATFMTRLSKSVSESSGCSPAQGEMVQQFIGAAVRSDVFAAVATLTRRAHAIWRIDVKVISRPGNPFVSSSGDLKSRPLHAQGP